MSYAGNQSKGERFVYLSGIQDFFNNEIVAWYLSERNDLALVTKTLDMLSEKTDFNGILLHSDQGFQYTSKPFNHRTEKTWYSRQSLQSWKLFRQCLYRIILFTS
ncbi:DDE-type integrase/transposase/recombinase [Brevibacillus laterosporus]|uniref:DDE-type integrase/transposase/recombinase n=1 Tax=Brevibacillus laterosporus TaxID=1465 RepID=UPI003558ECA8